MIPQVDGQSHVNKELVHVEPILVDGSRAAVAPVFQAALKLTEYPQGRAEM
jgi:hypothetical protein